MPSSPFTVALIDLDGTIVDSAPGITSTLALVLTELGLPVPPPARLLEFVGPPILDGLRDVAGVEGDEAQRVLAAYRRHYRAAGAFDARPYDGIREALTEIGTAMPLAVATSKPESTALRILEHFRFTALFTVVAGASEDESRSRKAEVVERALTLLRRQGADVSSPVMVGDRSHDVVGAAEHGVPTIVAGWGYGAPEERAGAIGAAETPGDLPALVLAGSPAPAS